MTLSSLQFNFNPADYGVPARHPNMFNNTLSASISDSFGTMHVGDMSWNDKTGEIQELYVNPGFRRKGVATELFNKADDYYYDPDNEKWVRHSPNRTEAGDAWAKAVGGMPVPPLANGTHLPPIKRNH